jgi:hypothetical protein
MLGSLSHGLRLVSVLRALRAVPLNALCFGVSVERRPWFTRSRGSWPTSPWKTTAFRCRDGSAARSDSRGGSGA